MISHQVKVIDMYYFPGITYYDKNLFKKHYFIAIKEFKLFLI